jgi:hypothetical protein
MLLSKKDAQKKISIFWFVSSGILAILFIVFTVLNRFDGNTMKAWEWYSQNILPSLSLMIATFHASTAEMMPEKMIDRYYFKIGYWISIFYHSAIYITIFLAPVAFRFADLSIIDLMERSKIYLTIIQGIVTYALGLFFVNEK